MALLAVALLGIANPPQIGRTQTASAQPPRDPQDYVSPTSLAECRADPERFGHMESLHRRRADAQFYAVRYVHHGGHLRVAVDRRATQLSEVDILCAFVVASLFLYESLSERCRDNIAAAYGRPYRYYDVFRVGFALANAQEPRFFMAVPDEQDSEGLGLPFDHEEGANRPGHVPRDRSCPTSCRCEHSS